MEQSRSRTASAPAPRRRGESRPAFRGDDEAAVRARDRDFSVAEPERK